MKEIVEITSNIDVATCSDTEINGISEEVKIQFEADIAMESMNGLEPVSIAIYTKNTELRSNTRPFKFGCC